MGKKISVCFFAIFLFLQLRSQLLDSCFHADSLKAIVETLASDSFKGRLSGTKGSLDAANFIAEKFRMAGLKPVQGGDGYFWPVGKFGYNVIGAIPGKSKSEEMIIFSAHYDHIGTIKTNPTLFGKQSKALKGDSVFNGANDDASGVAAVISLANYFAKRKNNERTILFIAFTGEELGLLGSKSFAAVLKPELVSAMINIEMIGRANGKSIEPYVTGGNQSNLMEMMNRRLRDHDAVTFKKPFFIKDYYTSENLFERSDNYSFADYGIPAHSIMLTSPADKYYHSLDDETSTLDFSIMSKIVQAIAIGSSGLVSGEDTPTRFN